MNNQKKWDIRFLELARFKSQWSKDPSTKVGCVIVDKNKREISTGYNGFAQGIKDSKERYDNRDIKYKMVLHSEINAIIFAQRDLTGCTIYTYPMPPCAICTSAIIQAGIKRIVAITPSDDQRSRWQKDFDLSQAMMNEAGIECVYYSIESLDKKINMQGQSKKSSLFEVICNTGSGFIIAWILSMYLLPLYETKNLGYSDGLEITTIYTIVSVLRSYIWRRFFNRLFTRKK
jgi:dCMP deaminase